MRSTPRREACSWLAILFAFPLGTAVGDLVAAQFGLRYLATGVLFAMIIMSVGAGYALPGLDAILGFWIVYIVTRPPGASFGDLLSQPHDYGGMGLGTVATSLLFLTVITLVVAAMTLRRNRRTVA